MPQRIFVQRIVLEMSFEFLRIEHLLSQCPVPSVRHRNIAHLPQSVLDAITQRLQIRDLDGTLRNFTANLALPFDNHVEGLSIAVINEGDRDSRLVPAGSPSNPVHVLCIRIRQIEVDDSLDLLKVCLLYTSPSPRDS
eukprot:TRINITY_DN6419_c0_g1_i9.p1 TRINITY_DN6419_c0_g1~~TRINITY_DN6419_c0_g1_i9.p1  ORF type:complete len:138 (-),score=5.68 TRINITY_DN6419_c0_g1_i9:150-563(-)